MDYQLFTMWTYAKGANFSIFGEVGHKVAEWEDNPNAIFGRAKVKVGIEYVILEIKVYHPKEDVIEDEEDVEEDEVGED